MTNMTLADSAVLPSYVSPAVRRRRMLNTATGLAMILPGFLLIVGLIAYPFAMSIYLSLTDAQVSSMLRPKFIGLDNFTRLLGDTVFLRAVANSFIFTAIAVALKIALGMAMAL